MSARTVEATSRQLLLEKVGHVLKRLPEKEQAVVEGVYLNDVEQKHLAKSLDVSLPYVYRLQKRGIRRVRGMLSRFIHESRQLKIFFTIFLKLARFR